MSRASHRAPARTLGRVALPGVLAFFTWLAENTPGGWPGFLGLIGLGLLISLFYPLAALLLIEAPGALVPWQWRAWYRHGRERRPAIRKWLKRVVQAADRHACAFCRSSADLQFDHVRPWSLGGRTSFFNAMTLCRDCNLAKSNYWVHRSGRVTFNPVEGYLVPGRPRRGKAAQILAFELRHRWSIARFIRAAVAL